MAVGLGPLPKTPFPVSTRYRLCRHQAPGAQGVVVMRFAPKARGWPG